MIRAGDTDISLVHPVMVQRNHSIGMNSLRNFVPCVVCSATRMDWFVVKTVLISKNNKPETGQTGQNVNYSCHEKTLLSHNLATKVRISLCIQSD